MELDRRARAMPIAAPAVVSLRRVLALLVLSCGHQQAGRVAGEDGYATEYVAPIRSSEIMVRDCEPLGTYSARSGLSVLEARREAVRIAGRMGATH